MANGSMMGAPSASMFGGALDSPWAKLAMTLGPALMAYGFEQPGLAQIGPQMLGMEQKSKEEAAERAVDQAEIERQQALANQVAGMFGAPSPAGGVLASADPGMPPPGAPPGGGMMADPTMASLPPPAAGPSMFDSLTPDQRQILQAIAIEDPVRALTEAAGMVEPASSGTFAGTGLQSQAWNILLDPAANPNSADYAAAYSIVSQPRTQQIPTAGGGVTLATITPEIPPNIRRPGGAAPTGQPVTQPGQPPPQPAAGPTVTPIPGTEAPRVFNQDQTKAAGFANRALASMTAVNALEDSGFEPAALLEQRGDIPIVGNLMASPEFQQYRRNQLDFITAVLRRESGAAISEAEFENEAAKYFPAPGDSQAVIADKRLARQRAIDSLIADSQGAYGQLFGGGGVSQPAAVQAFERGTGADVEPQGTRPGSDVMPDVESMPRPTTQEGYDALPAGAWYVGPDGVTYRKGM